MKSQFVELLYQFEMKTNTIIRYIRRVIVKKWGILTVFSHEKCHELINWQSVQTWGELICKYKFTQNEIKFYDEGKLMGAHIMHVLSRDLGFSMFIPDSTLLLQCGIWD